MSIRSKLNCPTATQLVELCARWTAQTADRAATHGHGTAASSNLGEEIS